MMNRDTWRPRKKTAVLFFINFIIIGAIYAALIHPHYATDTYSNIFTSYSDFQLSVGRYSNYLLISFFNMIGVPFVSHLPAFMFLAICILSVGSTMMFQLCDARTSSKLCQVGTDIAIIICFANVFSTELYLFPEYAVCFALGVTLAVSSVALLFQEKPVYYLCSFVILIISLGFYQANIGIYFIVFLGVCWLRQSQKRGLLILGLGIGGAAGFTNVLFQRLLVTIGVAEGTVRDARFTLQTIIDNLKIILFDKSQGQVPILFHGAGLLPSYCLIIVIGILTALLLLLTYLKAKTVGAVAQTFFVLIFMYVSVYIPHFFAGEVWLSPRAIMPMFFSLGMLMIMVLHCSQDFICILKIVSIIIAAFFAIDYWSVQGIIVNHFATNKIDQDYAYDIYREIQRYEEETGIIVQNIAPVNDCIPSWKNHFVDYYSFNVNERAFLNEWSDVQLVSFVSGRSFNRINMNEDVYQKQFMEKDWDYYCPEEQLYFLGDTLYWCKY